MVAGRKACEARAHYFNTAVPCNKSQVWHVCQHCVQEGKLHVDVRHMRRFDLPKCYVVGSKAALEKHLASCVAYANAPKPLARTASTVETDSSGTTSAKRQTTMREFTQAPLDKAAVDTSNKLVLEFQAESTSPALIIELQSIRHLIGFADPE